MDKLQSFLIVFMTYEALIRMLLDFNTVPGVQCGLNELFNWMMGCLIIGGDSRTKFKTPDATRETTNITVRF